MLLTISWTINKQCNFPGSPISPVYNGTKQPAPPTSSRQHGICSLLPMNYPSVCVLIQHHKHCTGSYYKLRWHIVYYWSSQTCVQLHFHWTLKSKSLLENSAHDMQCLLSFGKESQHLSDPWAHILICDFPWCSDLVIICSYSSI